jgi:hypothetical protein
LTGEVRYKGEPVCIQGRRMKRRERMVKKKLIERTAQNRSNKGDGRIMEIVLVKVDDEIRQVL